jgi:hypothetical protein
MALFRCLSLFFFSPRVHFLGFFMQPRPTGVSRAGLIFCSTFVSSGTSRPRRRGQKWKKPQQEATTNRYKSENLKKPSFKQGFFYALQLLSFQL